GGAELVLEALGAGPMPGHGRRATRGTAGWRGLAVTAVVAGHEPGSTVQDQRHLAVRAHRDRPAGAAGEEVRPAAPVQEHDRLALLASHVGQRHPRAWVERLV